MEQTYVRVWHYYLGVAEGLLFSLNVNSQNQAVWQGNYGSCHDSDCSLLHSIVSYCKLHPENGIGWVGGGCVGHQEDVCEHFESTLRKKQRRQALCANSKQHRVHNFPLSCTFPLFVCVICIVNKLLVLRTLQYRLEFTVLCPT